KKPFFAATYIPKESRFGRVGMMEFIPRIKNVWEDRHQEVLDSAEKITTALQSMETEPPGEDLDDTVFHKAYQELESRFDRNHGGFSQAPKFPTPHNFSFMLRYWKRFGEEKALGMVEETLQAMRQGGIYDHIGYGFHRYSTDKEWLVPHFEKMLYDQALLAMAYLEVFQITGKKIYGETAREILSYVLRDMTSPEGGFYSAEDADSEGVEGKVHVWREDEVRGVLGKEAADLIIALFNIEKNGNFKEEASGHPTGTNIFHLRKPLPDMARELGVPLETLEKKVASARTTLFNARKGRVHPHKDDKILTDWNGLMIAALARASQILGDVVYARTAEKAVQFILSELRDKNGRLLHRYREGEAKIAAHLDDHAFLTWGLIELYEATFEPRYLRNALEINEHLLKHFWDDKSGGFFFTPDDGERLIVRKKEIYDGAVPSGNAVAMWNLLRLARFTGRTDLDERAAKIDNAFYKQINAFPSGYTQFLVGFEFGIGPTHEVVITGTGGSRDTVEMIDAVRRLFIPNRVLIFRPTDVASPEIDQISPFVKEHRSLEGKATAYVCVNNACKAPTRNIKEMLEQLK
ncbi:MAG: thioredoxin domain-containing protein, partial [Deltaproteobacteria bacterium]|nr:thioredoxin domain-containing protein [Deltaproteobacteria bacterium]